MSENLHSSIEADLKNALQRAFKCFGTSRHWVTAYVEPELRKMGLTVVPIDEVEASSVEHHAPDPLKFVLRRVKNQIDHLFRKYEPRTERLDGRLLMVGVAEVIEDLDTLRILAARED